jgi:dihydroorotase
MKTVLKNAHLVGPAETKDGDLLIKDGLIAKIGGAIDAPGAEEIDCSDKWILPGVIDAHVHFRSPGYEYKEGWETGSRAALAGGVTTVFDMPNTQPQTTTVEALEQKRAMARKQSLVNFGLFMGATGDNVNVINEVEGIVGVKVYMGQTTGQKIDDPDEALDTMLRDLFERTHRVIAVHAEDEGQIRKHIKTHKDEELPEIHSLIRNDSVAFTAARRAVHIAKKYSGRLHICHLSTKKEVELLK